jgi:hypothetical protein
MPRLNGAPEGGHPEHAGNGITGMVREEFIAETTGLLGGFLMRRGFTVVWSGWQGDVPPGADRLMARFPTSRSCPRNALSARCSIR